MPARTRGTWACVGHPVAISPRALLDEPQHQDQSVAVIEPPQDRGQHGSGFSRVEVAVGVTQQITQYDGSVADGACRARWGEAALSPQRFHHAVQVLTQVGRDLAGPR